MNKRFEFKYILDQHTALKIRDYLEKIPSLTLDPYAKKGFYIVNSLYFDTPQFDDYRNKDDSLLARKKLRARIYEDQWSANSNKIWLEVKDKYNMFINKERTPISSLVWKDPLQIPSSRFRYLYLRHNYKPLVIIKYQRLAYLDKLTYSVRVTFDKNIAVCKASDLLQQEFMTNVSGNQVVMEIKFQEKLPWWFTQAITKFNLRRDDFSKYRNSVAILRGLNRIPINK